MANNDNLHAAHKNKNDEFYTLYKDVENELQHYEHHFKGKVVYCNCDNPDKSAFWKYFHLNFARLGLKKLIATHYIKGKYSYASEYCGGNDEDVAYCAVTILDGDGDFRSDECIKLLDECDIVCTNEPFSLFRQFIDLLVSHNKKFLIVGNMNAITYKEFFPLIKANLVWIGYNHIHEFIQPDGTIKKFGNICWFTNLDIQKRHQDLPLTKHYNPKDYPKFINYDAINVDKISDIPCDYFGVMGVPITFLEKYNPEQFEIVAFRKGNDGKDLVFTIERERERERRQPYFRILVQPRLQE